MKIGLVCPYSIAKGGGVQEIVRALCDELNSRGHEARIITPQPREYSAADVRNVIFLGNAADLRSPMHTTAQISASISNEAIDNLLAEEQFDILHFHEPWVPVLSRQILSRSNTVNIASFHANIPGTLMSQTVMRVVTPYLRSVLRYLHHLTAVSEAAAEYIGTMTNEPIEIIPNGINLQAYKRQPLNKEPLPRQMILYIGRLERRKGVKYLLQAYQRLAAEREDVELVIAGDGPDRQKLADMVTDHKIPRVSFLGYVSEHEKHELLQMADVFCSPALYGESFGIVLLEAMASGLPLVAGNNSGYSGLLQGTGGLSLINPEDSLEFVRRLDLFLNEPKLRKLWKDWARDYVKQYNWPNVIDQYEEMYTAVLAARRQPVALLSDS